AAIPGELAEWGQLGGGPDAGPPDRSWALAIRAHSRGIGSRRHGDGSLSRGGHLAVVFGGIRARFGSRYQKIAGDGDLRPGQEYRPPRHRGWGIERAERSTLRQGCADIFVFHPLGNG